METFRLRIMVHPAELGDVLEYLRTMIPGHASYQLTVTSTVSIGHAPAFAAGDLVELDAMVRTKRRPARAKRC